MLNMQMYQKWIGEQRSGFGGGQWVVGSAADALDGRSQRQSAPVEPRGHPDQTSWLGNRFPVAREGPCWRRAGRRRCTHQPFPQLFPSE